MMTVSSGNPYSPSENFFLAWGKDEKDRWVYVGLDHDETQELMRLQGVALDGDEVVITTWDRVADDSGRYLELHDKHERVRLQLCARHTSKRWGLPEKPH